MSDGKAVIDLTQQYPLLVIKRRFVTPVVGKDIATGFRAIDFAQTPLALESQPLPGRARSAVSFLTADYGAIVPLHA